MQFAAILVGGLLLGSLYGLAACGLSFVFGVMTIINVAHAEFIMLGAFTTFWMWFLLKINPLITIIPSMLIIFVICIFVYRAAISRIVGEMQLVSLILTFGISIFLWNFAQVFFTSTFRSVAYSTGSVSFLGSFFAVNKIISLIIVSAIIGCLYAFLKWTRIGKAIRAVSQNPDIAAISGIDIDRIRMFGFAIGGALAAVAGSLIAIQWSIYPLMGSDLILKCFAIVAIGGLGSIPGAFLGGLILGVAETMGTMYWDATMANVIAPLLLILTFLLRPQGLFGVEERVD
jgi:branched-chain amino acid transport system permease protein